MTTKYDNLNRDHLRPEDLEELARQDSYTHTPNDAYRNRHAERQEVARRVWENMQQKKKDPDPLD